MHKIEWWTMNIYRFGSDEHIPWCQRSDSVQQQYEKNQVESIARWIDFHFCSIHCHVWPKKENIFFEKLKIDQLTFQNRIVPLKFNSSFGKLFASHAGVSRTGFAKNGARSTSVLPLPSTLEEMNTYAWEINARVWTTTQSASLNDDTYFVGRHAIM